MTASSQCEGCNKEASDIQCRYEFIVRIIAHAPQGTPDNRMTEPLIDIQGNPNLTYAFIFGSAPYEPSQLDRLKSALIELGRTLSTRELSFKWAVGRGKGKGVFVYELNLQSFEEESSQHRLLVRIVVREARSARREIRSAEALDTIDRLLKSIAPESLGVKFHGNLAWRYSIEEVTPKLTLPFDVLVATESELTTVRGIRVTNGDGTAWAILDVFPGGEIVHVTAGFEVELVVNETTLQAALSHGKELVAGILLVKGD